MVSPPEKPSFMTSLADIEPGSRVVVTDVLGDDPATMRLLEMGVTPGADIRLVGVAPLGDPLEIEVRGYRLSVRRGEAAAVHVRPSA